MIATRKGYLIVEASYRGVQGEERENRMGGLENRMGENRMGGYEQTASVLGDLFKDVCIRNSL